MINPRRVKIRTKMFKNLHENVNNNVEFREMDFYIQNSLYKDMDFYNTQGLKEILQSDITILRRTLYLIR